MASTMYRTSPHTTAARCDFLDVLRRAQLGFLDEMAGTCARVDSLDLKLASTYSAHLRLTRRMFDAQRVILQQQLANAPTDVTSSNPLLADIERRFGDLFDEWWSIERDIDPDQQRSPVTVADAVPKTTRQAIDQLIVDAAKSSPAAILDHLDKLLESMRPEPPLTLPQFDDSPPVAHTRRSSGAKVGEYDTFWHGRQSKPASRRGSLRQATRSLINAGLVVGMIVASYATWIR